MPLTIGTLGKPMDAGQASCADCGGLSLAWSGWQRGPGATTATLVAASVAGSGVVEQDLEQREPAS
jgi:hypothetical protein